MIRVMTFGAPDYDHARAASFHRLRKRKFADELGWQVQVSDGFETDDFDRLPHLLVLDELDDAVVAGMRLMPMSGPTMLASAFSHMLPDAGDFRSPTIWEVSRYCIDNDRLDARTRTGANESSMRLSYASLIATRDRGGTHHIAVVDRRILSLIRLFGAAVEVIGSDVSSTGMDIYCAIWPIDDEFLQRMAWVKTRWDGMTDPTREHALIGW